jgi:hypothetical protein
MQPDFTLKALEATKSSSGSLPYILLVFAEYLSFSLLSETP